MNDTTNTKKGIPGSTLKIIAIITMLLDHIGAAILERMLAAKGYYFLGGSSMEEIMNFVNENKVLITSNTILRLIGRLGFPIFCFLLIEGFLYTRNVWKYAFRLFLFSIISEIPFNLAFRSKFFDRSYQNVFFTLFLGLMALIFIRMVEEKLKVNKFLQYMLMIPITALFMFIAESKYLFCSDYGAFGILTIVIMYLLRKNKILEMAGGCVSLTVMSLSEVTSFFALIPIFKYNGKRGLKLKYAFYIFYPAHLLILYLISYFMGISDAFKGLIFY